MQNVDHIGIAVKDLAKSNKLFESLLAVPPYKMEYVASENVSTSFFKTGETKIELVASDEEENVINRFIEKRGEGIHHIAFEVENILKEMKRLSQEGFRLLNDQPKRGADNKWVCFLHPKSSNGVLIEICQSIPDEEE